MTEMQQTKPRRGCLFYGCLTLAILSLALLVGGGLGLFFLYQKAEAFVAEYAATAPAELPMVRYTESDQREFERRLQAFAEGLSNGDSTVPLVLKGEDLNLLMASSPDLKTLSEGIRARIEGDEIKGQVSLKLGDLGAPFFKDRYLNGEISLKALLIDGRLVVSVNEVTINGRALPEKHLSALRDFNFAENAGRDPEVNQTLERIESIEVSGGSVRVVPKAVE